MNKSTIKQASILSAILGGILGVLTLIPFVRNFSFMVLILFLSAVVIVYMKKNDLISIIDAKEGAILGSITGFASFIAFWIIFAPLSMLVGLILPKTYIGYLAAFFKTLPFFVFLMLGIFGAILSALMNSFAGLVTAYVYETLSGVKKEESEQTTGNGRS
ncbi:MAG: hypothetical protein WCY19_00750 [Candidatus Gastranaerophilaceae bacterium]